MKRINFTNSINELRDNFDFSVRKFQSFSFGTRAECREILEKSILASDLTIQKFEWIPEYDQIVDWMTDTKGKGLFLMGDVGRGKTNIISHSLPLIFFHLKRKVIKTTQAVDLHKRLNEFRGKALISVDELGTETEQNDYGVKSEPASVLFDMAEANGKTLFVSTNYSSKQIADRYGNRALDRIIRLCRVVKFEGKSMRK